LFYLTKMLSDKFVFKDQLEATSNRSLVGLEYAAFGPHLSTAPNNSTVFG
jgi:hypothetical protein